MRMYSGNISKLINSIFSILIRRNRIPGNSFPECSECGNNFLSHMCVYTIKVVYIKYNIYLFEYKS